MERDGRQNWTPVCESTHAHRIGHRVYIIDSSKIFLYERGVFEFLWTNRAWKNGDVSNKSGHGFVHSPKYFQHGSNFCEMAYKPKIFNFSGNWFYLFFSAGLGPRRSPGWVARHHSRERACAPAAFHLMILSERKNVILTMMPLDCAFSGLFSWTHLWVNTIVLSSWHILWITRNEAQFRDLVLCCSRIV